MRRILLLLIILTPLINISQTKNVQTFTVSGKIIDAATKIPLEDATIIFKKIDSNAINCGTITNSRGNFSIDVKEGTYDAFIEFISYKSKNINISSINRNLKKRAEFQVSSYFNRNSIVFDNYIKISDYFEQ